MPEPAVTLPDSTGLSASNWIDAVCDQYERELQAGQAPWPAYLRSCPPERQPRLLAELLRLHWDFRGPETVPPSPQAECAEFPDWSGVIESTWQEFLQEHGPGANRDASLESTVLPDPQETWSSAEPAAGETLPVSIGRYQVTCLLGAGAFGQVYQARDEQLQRTVAVKLSRQPLTTSAEQTAALREARHLAALDHPRIVPVYDVGQTESGQLFIVSKWIDGASLHEVLERKTFTPAESAELVLRMAEGLAYAHQQGVYHRDIKPANVLIDTAGRVYLADFGLAVHYAEQGQQRGIVAGTPAYMSPEQARGEAQWLDGRSDLWSLGVVLYRLLTGHQPFTGAHWREVFEEILQRDPRPPRQWDETIPEPLERIALKCLAKPATARYATAGDLLADLRRWQQTRRAEVAPRSGYLKLLALLALLPLAGWGIWRAAFPDPDATLPTPRETSQTTTDPPQVPMKGWIDVRLWKQEQGPPAGEGLRLHQAGVLPLRPGDFAQVEIQLNQPAYLYVVMLEAGGTVAPMYPWQNYDWSDRGPESLREGLLIPDELGSASPFTNGPAGIEGLLLMVRPTPLPAGADAELASAFAAWSRQTRPPDPLTAVWLENGNPVTDEAKRARLGSEQVGIDNPVATARALMAGPLTEWFDYTRGVCYAFQGE